MKSKSFFLVLVICLSTVVNAQNKKPKLIIGIVVDQMRYDYLDMYYANSKVEQKGGFIELISNGLVFTENYLGYMPSYTGPGHATVYTGVTPYMHGIIANDWYDRGERNMVYCVDDDDYSGVGGSGHENKSPHRLTYPTIGDKIKEADNQSKVIGVALKDRAAVLPAGKKGDYAFWFDSETGDFVTSTYYAKNLPEWVEQFNKQKLALKYLKAPWDLMYPKAEYNAPLADDNPYEALFEGESNPVFPHRVNELMSKNHGVSIIKKTPYGNTFTAEFAKMAIVNEGLGQDDHTDLLTLSFSSTDYIGHMYGPGSLELEDTYYRLNFVIDDLLKFLNEQLGKDNYLLFLTADHGVQYNPNYAKDSLGKDVGFVDIHHIMEEVSDSLEHIYGVKGLISNAYDFQVYLNYDLIDSAGLKIKEVKKTIERMVMTHEGIRGCYTDVVELKSSIDPIMQIISAGIMLERSGDIFILLEEGWLLMEKYGITGTSHGSPYNFDTHIPLIFYGAGVPAKKISKKVQVTGVVSALYKLMGIEKITGLNATAIEEYF